MDKFPSSFREASPVDQLPAERERIFKAVMRRENFRIHSHAKELMLELHKRFPNTFQIWKELVSGLDNAPTGSCAWVTVDAEELAPEYRITSGTLFRVKDFKPQ